MGSGAKPQPTNDLVHIWAKRSSSGGNSFMDFHGNKFNFSSAFTAKNMLKLLMTRDMVSCAFRITGMFVHFEQERFELVVTCQLWCLEFFTCNIYF